MTVDDLDADLEGRSREELIDAVKKLRAFLRGCVRYRQSLDEQLPNAPRSDEPYPS